MDQNKPILGLLTGLGRGQSSLSGFKKSTLQFRISGTPKGRIFCGNPTFWEFRRSGRGANFLGPGQTPKIRIFGNFGTDWSSLARAGDNKNVACKQHFSRARGVRARVRLDARTEAGSPGQPQPPLRARLSRARRSVIPSSRKKKCSI